MTRIGAGAYAGATIDSIRATHASTVLIMPLDQCQWVADALSGGVGHTLILRGDEGNDNDQFDENQPPEAEARRFFDRFLAPKLNRWHWDAVLGPCETWRREPGANVPQPHLTWRAAFELTLCRIVQNERHLPYLWGSIPIGNLEPSDLPIFAGILAEATGTAAHLYLGPGRRTVAEEVDPWYLWRPTQLWLPECKRLGLRFPPLIATEVGTYYPPGQTGLTMAQYARLCVNICDALTAECNGLGVEFLGGIGFGFGTVGTMDVWRMDGTEPIIAAANPESVSISGGMPHPGDTTMTDAELSRYVADLYHRFNVALNTNGALYKHWLAALKAGRFLGPPMENEHATESGAYIVQAFASAILSYNVGTGAVTESLPL